MAVGPDLVLKVTIPRRFSERAARKFVDEKRQWVFRSIISQVRKRQRSFELRFEDGAYIPFLGEFYTLRVYIEPKRSSVVLQDDHMIVTVASGDRVKTAVENFYKKEARRVISDVVSFYAKKLGLKYKRISIRDQQTRWGSCSSEGNLNFSYRLVMAPLKVIDYVVVHELCHLTEMNHSKRFWSLVASVLPDFEKQKKWLNDHGHALQF
jgi:predicted metal-dependent hydrolase